MAAAANVPVAAVTASATGRLVEIEAQGLGSPRSPVEVSRREDILSMVGARANVAIGLS